MNPFDHLHPLVPFLIILLCMLVVFVLALAAMLSKHDAPPRQPMLTEPDQHIDDQDNEKPARRLRAIASPNASQKVARK